MLSLLPPLALVSIVGCYRRSCPLHRMLELPQCAQEVAKQRDFQLLGCQFGAAREQLRPPHTVRVGLVQNAVVLPTSAPIMDQVRCPFRCRLQRAARAAENCQGCRGLPRAML